MHQLNLVEVLFLQIVNKNLRIEFNMVIIILWLKFTENRRNGSTFSIKIKILT